MTKPPKSVFDPSFRYVPAARSDIRKTFDRIKRQQREAERASEAKIVRILKVRSGT